MVTPNTFPVEKSWRVIFKDIGVNPANVLRRAQLPEDLFSRPNASLTPDEYFRFWEGLEAEYGSPELPIHLVQSAAAESFSPPVFAALCSPTLSVAAERLSTYKKLVCPMKLDVMHSDVGLSITFEWLHATLEPPRAMVAMEFAFFTGLARLATREHVVPLQVVSPRLPEAMEAFTDFLGTAVVEGDVASMTFSYEDAQRPFLTANDAMWDMFEPELRRRLADLEDSATVRDRVSAALLETLPSGQTSMEAVAKKLAVSKRTLQRRLQGEETTFAKVLNETRTKLAHHYLQKTALTCSEISFLVGYEEPSSFFRAFHEWTGETPEAARQRMLTAVVSP